jgi:hypothetical protein
LRITIYSDTSANFSCKSGLRRPKAAEDCRSPRRFANARGMRILECASPLALWCGRAEPKSNMCSRHKQSRHYSVQSSIGLEDCHGLECLFSCDRTPKRFALHERSEQCERRNRFGLSRVLKESWVRVQLCGGACVWSKWWLRLIRRSCGCQLGGPKVRATRYR